MKEKSMFNVFDWFWNDLSYQFFSVRLVSFFAFLEDLFISHSACTWHFFPTVDCSFSSDMLFFLSWCLSHWCIYVTGNALYLLYLTLYLQHLFGIKVKLVKHYLMGNQKTVFELILSVHWLWYHYCLENVQKGLFFKKNWSVFPHKKGWLLSTF